MLAITIIILIFLMINFFADIVEIITKNKYIKVMEQQNKLLWSVLKESNNISIELVKQNLKKDGGNTHE